MNGAPFDDVTSSFHVDLVKIARPSPGRRERARVHDGVDAGAGLVNRESIPQIDLSRLRAQRLKQRARFRITPKGANAIAAREEGPRERAAEESGGTGHENRRTAIVRA
jgi:hypothetical protein